MTMPMIKQNNNENFQTLASQEWWENYFSPDGGWEKNGGRRQTQLFAEAFCNTVALKFDGSFSLIDIGCALGDAIAVLQKHYPQATFFGYDFSEVAVSRCRTQFNAIASFKSGTIESLEGFYDVVYVSNVLEHFVDYRDKVRLLTQKCRQLCIMVPYNERFNGKELNPDPNQHHQVTFSENSFNFLIHEGRAQEIKYHIVSCPGAWGWTRKQKIIETSKNLVRRLLGRPPVLERLQIIYDIKVKETGTDENKQQDGSCFKRSGIASLSDIENNVWKSIFDQLEEEQAAFSKEKAFFSAEYKWPHDPLHTWSRVWEYPYVYYHMRQRLSTTTQPWAVDVGCGVTFFPFSIARLGYRVTCIDIDPIVERGMAQAIPHTPCNPGHVAFSLTDGKALPLEDSIIDVVYCISVLEHFENFETTIDEMARVLKPGGLLLLTIDLDLRGDSEIGLPNYERLIESLSKRFDFLYKDTTIHPADMLTSANGPHGYKTGSGLKKAGFLLKQNIINPLMGRPKTLEIPFYLTVQGLALQKKNA